MDKEETKQPLKYEEEKEVELGLDFDDDIDPSSLFGKKEDAEDEDEDDQDDDYGHKMTPKATYWVDSETDKLVHGVEIRATICQRGERDDLDLCSICFQPWTMDQEHQMSCPPCGHIFGMSCLKKMREAGSPYTCPKCHVGFSFESVRLLYATRLCIPDETESVRRFRYNKSGFTAFKQYQRELLTNAINNKSHALKQRALVLARQKDAMKQRTKLLNRMTNTQKQVEALACLAGAEKRAESLRRRADALGQRADENLRKADAFGQQAKALRQRSNALRQRVGAYTASMKFFKQSYEDLLALHGIRSQMDKEEDHKPMEANKEYKKEQEEQQEEEQQEQQEQQEEEQQQEEEEQQEEQQEQEQLDMDFDLDENDVDGDDDEYDDEVDGDDDEYDDDDDDDNDDDDDGEDEVDDKETSLLPEAASWIDLYSGKTVDGVEVPSNKRKRDEEEEEESVDGVEVPSNKRKRYEEEEEETIDGVEVPSNKRKRDEEEETELPSNKRKRDEEEHIELELDLDDNGYAFEQVEEMTLPLVISRIDNGKVVYEIEVPVMKDDDYIDDSMYRDDVEPTDALKDFAEALDSRPPEIQAKAPDVCTICFKHWTRDEKHRVCCLPCGHIFGASCIKRWLQTDICASMCPQCKTRCKLSCVRPLYATSLSIPAADIGGEDQKTPTRHFLVNKVGQIRFLKLEIARRNVALKKWCDAKKRLDVVLGRKNDAMKRRTDLLNKMKALEQQGGSFRQAGALGALVNEYLRRAKAYVGRAEALRHRAKAYYRRLNATDPRLQYFAECRKTFLSLDDIRT